MLQYSYCQGFSQVFLGGALSPAVNTFQTTELLQGLSIQRAANCDILCEISDFFTVFIPISNTAYQYTLNDG